MSKFEKGILIPYIIGIGLLIFCMFILTGCEAEPTLPTDEIQVYETWLGDSALTPHIKIELKNGYTVKDYLIDYENQQVILNLEVNK